MITLGPSKTPLYTDAGKRCFLKLSGHVAQPFFRLHATKPEFVEGAQELLVSNGDSSADATARLDRLRPRPVYLTNSAGGKVCLVVGALGGDVDPYVDAGIAAWMSTGRSPNVLSEVSPAGPYDSARLRALGFSDFEWRSAGLGHRFDYGPIGNAPMTRLPSGTVAAIAGVPRAVAFSIVAYAARNNSVAYTPAHGAVLIKPAVGDDTPGIYGLSAVTPGFTTCFTDVDRPNNPAGTVTMLSTDSVFNGKYGSGLVDIMDIWEGVHYGPFTSHPSTVWSSNTPNESSVRPYALRRRATKRVSDGLFDAYTSRLSANAAGYAEATGFPLPVAELGLGAPFPFLSKAVGWVTGLPHEISIFVIDFMSSTVSDDTIVVDDWWLAADYPAATLQRLFPVWNAPSQDVERVNAAYASLDQSIWLRTVLSNKGFDYGAKTYDTTTFATNAIRAGSTLDEIMFDDLEDGKPPISYLSLAGRAALVISGKRNRAVTLPLVSDGRMIASRSMITFSGPPTTIVATQNDVQIDAGEAQIAILLGAPTTFADGLTGTQVATGFFDLPTWEAVTTGNGEQAQSHVYCLDEAAITVNGTMISDSDAIARALPVVLGWGQEKFSAAIAAPCTGMYGPAARP